MVYNVNMSDINRPEPHPSTTLLYLREDELREATELLFFAYRDFTGDPDEILKDYGFGRAHHRVIYFIGRQPGMTVAELLSTLRITKQSLGRVLKQLVEEGFVEQKAGPVDRRQRLLTLTEKGEDLERRLFTPQQKRLTKAFREAGAEAVAGYRQVLKGLINQKERAKILRRIKNK